MVVRLLNLSFKLRKFIYRLFFSFFLLPRDDLWLNEAMAQFLQYKSIDAMYPELDVVRRKLLQNLLSLFIETKIILCIFHTNIGRSICEQHTSASHVRWRLRGESSHIHARRRSKSNKQLVWLDHLFKGRLRVDHARGHRHGRKLSRWS